MNRLLHYGAIGVGSFGASLLIAGGCSSHHQPYPQAWPPIVATPQQSCEQLTGTYQNVGQPRPSSLTRGLFGDGASVWPASEVTFSFPQVGQMQVIVSGAQGELFSGILPARQWVCRAGSVTITRDAQWQTVAAAQVMAILGRESVTLELHRLGDYLVVKEEQHTFMFVGFLLAGETSLDQLVPF